MHPPSRTRRILKWTGTALSVLILLAGCLSLFFVGFFPVGHEGLIAIEGGALQWYKDFNGGIRSPVIGSNQSLEIALKWPQIHGAATAQYELFGEINQLDIPLWLPLFLTAIPTAWLWHRDRRRILPGHCPRCGYDLTGNTSGVCSECGEKIDAGQRAASSTVRPEES